MVETANVKALASLATGAGVVVVLAPVVLPPAVVLPLLPVPVVLPAVVLPWFVVEPTGAEVVVVKSCCKMTQLA